MKAWLSEEYGGPEVFRLGEIEEPTPAADEVLIDVKAVALNPYDWHYIRGVPKFIRISGGLSKPKNTVLGSDVAGVVRTIGSDVNDISPGDEVFAEVLFGGFAQVVCAKATKLRLKPKQMSFEEAAGMPMAGVTALQGLRERGGIAPGMDVLINGASGGIGTYAVQLAKAFETHVTGVCSGRNLELVTSLGADAVIDYTTRDIGSTGTTYDLILDAVGNLKLSYLRGLLKPDGVAVVAGFSSWRTMIPILMQGSKGRREGKQSISSMVTDTTGDDLIFLADLVASGKLRTVIDRVVPFEKFPEAFAYLETGRARGKVLLTVAE